MARGGRAWRGWFPLGRELTDGVPDRKEGLYFGRELGPDDPRVRAGLPLHGSNLFPRRPRELAPAVVASMRALETAAQTVLAGIGLGLGLGPSWFAEHLTFDPVVLFRTFRYPALEDGGTSSWSVGEHTDYGLLTLLAQDDRGGLQVRTRAGWTDVPPIDGGLVCNLGDMLERLTGGRYRSTPHRVRNASGHDRLSFPFFLDPAWEAPVGRLPIVEEPFDDLAAERWDRASVHELEGPYGEDLLTKVSRVFPELAADVIGQCREG